jgi:GNAT superfamily N-acetyltransferase
VSAVEETHTELPVAFRDGRASDIGFVASNWLRSYHWHRECFFERCSSLTLREYYQGHHALVEWLLLRSRVVVAHNPDDDDQLYGFVCFEPLQSGLVVHYLYVKSSRRGWGVGRRLFHAIREPGQRTICTHWTRGLRSNKANVKHQLEVNPYYLWQGES